MAMDGRRCNRLYSREERSEILRDAEALGARESSERHGVPLGTVTAWRYRERQSRANRSRLDSEEKPRRKKTVARRYTPSEKANVLEYAAENGISAAAKKFNVSRFSIYKWEKKLEKASKGEGPSPTSGPSPLEIEEQRDREILDEWKKHPGLGPSQIRNQLRRRSIRVSVQTVRNVMESAGYRPPKVKREPHDLVEVGPPAGRLRRGG